MTGLQADFEGADIVVSWEKIKDEPVAYYRVYYSGESILDNDGVYDDFDQTDGPKSQYTFSGLPPGSNLYVAVLAVNEQGEESAAFAEEVSISVPLASGENASSVPFDLSVFDDIVSSGDAGVTPSSQSSASASPEAVKAVDDALQQALADQANANVDQFGGVLHLLGAKAESATTVSLTFSHEITVAPESAPQAFKVIRSAGGELAIRKLTIDGMNVMIETAPQERGTVYELRVSEPLTGKKNEPLDATDRQTLFMGHPTGSEPAAPVPVDTQPKGTVEKPENPTGLRLKATPSNDGLYTVDVRWDNADITGGLSYYLLAQSLDEGATFSEPQALPASMAGAELKGVYPGNFGIKLQAVNLPGNASEGIFKTIALAGTAQHPLEPEKEDPAPQEPISTGTIQPIDDKTPAATDTLASSGSVTGGLQGSILPQQDKEDVIPSTADTLPQSGNAFVLFTMIFAGTVVGWKQSRRSALCADYSC